MVALFTRAWIEMNLYSLVDGQTYVALFTRAWIEIGMRRLTALYLQVALFTRAWIEIKTGKKRPEPYKSPSSRGRGLK